MEPHGRQEQKWQTVRAGSSLPSTEWGYILLGTLAKWMEDARVEHEGTGVTEGRLEEIVEDLPAAEVRTLSPAPAVPAGAPTCYAAICPAAAAACAVWMMLLMLVVSIAS